MLAPGVVPVVPLALLVDPLEPLVDPVRDPLEPLVDPLIDPLEPLVDPLDPLELADPVALPLEDNEPLLAPWVWPVVEPMPEVVPAEVPVLPPAPLPLHAQSAAAASAAPHLNAFIKFDRPAVFKPSNPINVWRTTQEYALLLSRRQAARDLETTVGAGALVPHVAVPSKDGIEWSCLCRVEADRTRCSCPRRCC